jgi:hypothetical protein
MARGSGDPNPQTTVLVGIITAIMLFVVVVLLQALFYRVERGEVRRKVEAVVPEELARLRAAQLEQLNAYRWVDQAAGVAAIPIDRAIRLVVQEQGRGPAAGPTPGR